MGKDHFTFHRDYLLRLPLPLAQLYSRSYNAKSARARHDNCFYLFEGLIKLTAAPLVSAYVRDVRDGEAPVPVIDDLLLRLALPSMGHWVAIVRELSRHFGRRAAERSHPLGHVHTQLEAKHTGTSAILDLYRRICRGSQGAPGNDSTCTLLDLFDALVQYRNAVFGHGAVRDEAFYESQMGPLMAPAVNEILADGVLDALGPRGSRLVYLHEIRAISEDRFEVGLYELVGLEGERAAPLELASPQIAALAPQHVAVMWPGHPLPLRLDPLVVFRQRELADFLFLNRDRRGKHVEYLSYSTGRTERDHDMAPALAKLLSTVAGDTVDASRLDDLAQQSLSQTEPVEAIRESQAAPQHARLGDYEIMAEIGRGGMGVVYLARQMTLGRLVALKTLPADLAGDELAAARFRREIRALARCDHPNIVKVIDSGQTEDGQLYYTMEFVPGCDLEQVWRDLSDANRGRGDARDKATESDAADAHAGSDRTTSGTSFWGAVRSASHRRRREIENRYRSRFRGPADAPDPAPPTLPLPPLQLPPLPDGEEHWRDYVRQVCALVRDAARALQAVHDQHIVHRDVNPSNLMLTADGSRLVLMDFGLVTGRSVGATLTEKGGFVGKLRYAAPEQLAAAMLKVDHRADVRGLGVTLWELLTRRRLFADAADERELTTRVLNRDVPMLRQINDRLDPDLEAIVARATERDAERRISTAEQFAEYLDLYLADKSVPLRTPGPLELLGRWARENRRAVVGSAAAAMVVLAAVVVAFLLVNDARLDQVRAREEAESAKEDALQAKTEAQQALDASVIAVHVAGGHYTRGEAIENLRTLGARARALSDDNALAKGIILTRVGRFLSHNYSEHEEGADYLRGGVNHLRLVESRDAQILLAQALDFYAWALISWDPMVHGEAALTAERETLDIRSRLLGESHTLTLRARGAISAMLRLSGDTRAGEEMLLAMVLEYRDSRAPTEQEKGAFRLRLTEVVAEIDAFSRKGEHEEARKLITEVFDPFDAAIARRGERGMEAWQLAQFGGWVALYYDFPYAGVAIATYALELGRLRDGETALNTGKVRDLLNELKKRLPKSPGDDPPP